MYGVYTPYASMAMCAQVLLVHVHVHGDLARKAYAYEIMYMKKIAAGPISEGLVGKPGTDLFFRVALSYFPVYDLHPVFQHCLRDFVYISC